MRACENHPQNQYCNLHPTGDMRRLELSLMGNTAEHNQRDTFGCCSKKSIDDAGASVVSSEVVRW
jgi:hypothetical protein